MDESSEGAVIPEWLRSALSLLLTLGAVVLYAYILGLAEVRTYLEGAPIFEENMVRAAGLLSGLVGAVVAAGFAQGRTSALTPVSANHPMGGMVRTAWTSLRRPPRARNKFVGLAHVLGFRVRPSDTARPRQSTPGAEAAPAGNAGLILAVGVLYFVIYLIIGAGALALTITRPVVPELIANSGWVWLGTVLSVGYTFFGVGSS